MSQRRRRPNTITAVVYADQSSSLSEEAIDFDAAIRTFKRRCVVRNLTEDTLRYYDDMLLILVDCLAREDINRPIDVTRKHLEDAIIKRKTERKLTDSTLNTNIRGWRAFFNFLHDEGYIPENPAEGFKTIKAEKRVIETFTKPQLKALFNAPDRNTFTGYRDYVMMLTLFETGIRVAELEGAQIAGINWKDRLLKVYGKGRKERLVPFQDTLYRQLREYVSIRGLLDHDSLFVNIDNRPLKKRRIQEIISEYGEQANITGVRVSPHTFRHTFARNYIMNGGDVFSLQKILGHTSLEIVRTYVNLWGTDIVKQHRKFSPLERLHDDD